MAASSSRKLKTLQIGSHQLQELQPGIWRLEPTGEMRVGVHLIGGEALLRKLSEDRSIEQAANVATLPGVLDPVLTMPDIHQGYGFPIGGVAAFHERTGVISPGGVGYDINCGVRLLRTNLTKQQLEKQALKPLLSDLFERIPAGVGSRRGDFTPTGSDYDRLLREGAAWAVERGFGTKQDLQNSEERACIPGADPEALSERARERGFHQLGTLGSGNHFVELQWVDSIIDEKAARAFGIQREQIVVTIHTGSRGLGYQVCSDYLEASLHAAARHGIKLVDKELAAAPLESPEGKNYFKAMACAANFAFTNRQILTHWVRQTFAEHFPESSIEVVYDVCHNIAKFEEMPRGGRSQRVCIHRKGATRAYPPHHPSLPPAYREVGQPVLVPGDMGRYSYILAGGVDSLERSYGSACHGAGRELSRAQAKKRAHGRSIEQELAQAGILVRSAGRSTLSEEMSEAYKDVAEVVAATAQAGIATPVARLRPLAVVKG